MELMNMSCCGVKEIDGLSGHRSAEAALRSFAASTLPNGGYTYNYTGNRFRYAIFSQAGSRSRYGFRFAAFIRDNNLGDVIETAGNHINPNSGHRLRVWVWTVNHEAVRAWATAQPE